MIRRFAIVYIYPEASTCQGGYSPLPLLDQQLDNNDRDTYLLNQLAQWGK